MNAQENDESLLIDYCLGQLDEPTSIAVAQRLARDGDFSALHRSVANSLGALKLLPEREPPADLLQKTFARIRQARQTDALIAREEIGRGKRASTFSLREALAMAASFIVVALLFVPSVQQARRNGQINQCKSNIGEVGYALRSYANDHDQKLPVVGGKDVRWLPGRENVASNSMALFKLVSPTTRYARPEVFVCPAAADGKTHTIGAGMSDFPDAGCIQYSYQHALGARDLSFTDPNLAAVTAGMVILGDATPLFRGGGVDARQAATAVSDNHSRRGLNVLYMDMHVKWVEEPKVGVNYNNIYVADSPDRCIIDYRGDETPIGPTDTFLMPAYTARK